MRYALRNKHKIAEAFGEDYLNLHVVASLDAYFANANDWRVNEDINQELYAANSGNSFPLLRINDMADDNCMVEFAVINKQYDVLQLAYIGRMKG